jgi:nitrite reductase/ring-hydroxylating ferredoxin subunit
MPARLVAERLDFEGCRPVPPEEVLARVCGGEIIILRAGLQGLGYMGPLLEAVAGVLRPVIGPEAMQRVLAAGWERLHESVSGRELTATAGKLQDALRPLGLTYVKALARDVLGLAGAFYVEETHNVRVFLPQDVWQRDREKYTAFEKQYHRGKLTLHGPHADTSFYHPANVVNAWTAIGPVVPGNGMSFFPHLFGRVLPRGEDGCVRDDQVLGRALNFALRPGDTLLFHIGHVHGSEINQSGQTRFAMSGRFTVGEPELFDKPWHNYLHADEIPGMIGKKQAPHVTAGGLPTPPPVTLDTAGGRRPPIPYRRGPGPAAVDFSADDLAAGEIRPLNDEWCVARTERGWFVLGRRCPHEGADLTLGHLSDNCVRCPRHNLAIDPATGRSPCASLPALKVIPCRPHAGRVHVRLPAPGLWSRLHALLAGGR